MELHQKIAFIRKKKGLTQEQLADLANITVRTIQRIESGENVPRSYTLKAIAVALNVSFEELTNTIKDGNAVASPAEPAALSRTGDEQYFLQLLCLSCFSYFVIPWVHFLVPIYVLKRYKEQNLRVIAFGRQVIKWQVYWTVSVSLVLLLSLAYNSISAVYVAEPVLLKYLWVFFSMYLLNAFIIMFTIGRIKSALSLSIS